MYPTREELNNLFKKGLDKYKKGDFFSAHEFWEDMWHFKQLEDRKFVQGLIQLSASFFKIQCQNLRGAKSLLEKSINKFENYNGIHRGINVEKLKKDLFKIKTRYNQINSTREFSLKTVPSLE